jgi:RHS repeat-associated protein
MGRVVEERRTIGSASGKFIEYTYNLDGSLLKLTTPPLKTVVYTIGGAGRPLSAVDSADSLNFVTGASYAPHGELKGMVTGSTSSFAGFTITNGYNDRLQPVLLSASSPTRTVFSVCYDFHLGVNVTISPCSFSASTAGDNGSVYQVVNNRDSSRTQNLTYDNLNRIATGYSSGAHWGETFTVDPWSNLVGRAPYLTKPNYEPLTCAANASNQLTTCFGYDAAGNTTNNGSAAYTYDAENRITSTGGMFYTYDGEGNRVRKCSASPCTTGSTGTLYWRSTGGETLDESDLSGNATEEYVFFNGQRIARRDISTNVLHYYFSDYVNSTGVVENAAGTACEQDIDYYPYGGVENDYCVTPVPQNYKFTGKERDNESGLDDFDARYYASTMGRFMTPDWDVKPVTVPYAKFGDPQTLNLYGYVENSPVDRMDPSGHFTPPAQDMGFACDGNSECLARETGDQEAGQTQREAKYSGAQNQKAHNNVAMAAEKDALRRTRAALKHGQRVEYGGWIIQKNKDGSLSYTKPIKGGEGEFDLDSVTIPKGFTKVSPYHTHPHTRKTEGEGADPGDVNVLRNMVHDEHVDRVGYVADTFSGSVYRYTQWEPVKSMYDTSAFGTKIGTIPPD